MFNFPFLLSLVPLASPSFYLLSLSLIPHPLSIWDRWISFVLRTGSWGILDLVWCFIPQASLWKRHEVENTFWLWFYSNVSFIIPVYYLICINTPNHLYFFSKSILNLLAKSPFTERMPNLNTPFKKKIWCNNFCKVTHNHLNRR